MRCPFRRRQMDAAKQQRIRDRSSRICAVSDGVTFVRNSSPTCTTPRGQTDPGSVCVLYLSYIYPTIDLLISYWGIIGLTEAG